MTKGILWAVIDRETVLSAFPPKHPIIPEWHHPGQLHLTLWHGCESEWGWMPDWIGMQFTVNLYFERWDAGTHAVRAYWREGKIHELCQMRCPHVTLSLAEGRCPVEAQNTITNHYSQTSRKQSLDVLATIQFHPLIRGETWT